MWLRDNIATARQYVTSLIQAKKNPDFFRDANTYCMFVGYPRTGHSLIGSLLDAHPDIIVAHELNALKLVRYGFSQQQIFYLLLENSQRIAAAGRRHSGYSYEVPNQWQGRFAKLRVIGDKKGAHSSMCLHKNPELLDILRQRIGGELKFIHVMRNPYDVVSTMTRRRPHKALSNNIDAFFQLCESVSDLKRRINPTQLFDVRLEDFIQEPKSYLKNLCHFLAVESSECYLEDCARIVFKSPQKSRLDVIWNPELIQRVQEKMSTFDFLAGYSFDEDLCEPSRAQETPPSDSAWKAVTGLFVQHVLPSLFAADLLSVGDYF
jgi:hypothetical protein